MLLSKRLSIIYLSIGVLVVLLAQCSNFNNAKSADLRGPRYADAESCVRCHKDISSSFSETSHFHTSSQVKSLKEIPDSDSTFTFNDSLEVHIEKSNNKMYQVAYSNGQQIESHQFDIAFGSGEKASTYAYWEGNKLFQLPLTYYKAINKWTNSPGFAEDRVNYKRAILSRCLECHGSFAETKIVKTGSLSVSEEIVKGAVIYGIDCQRCHGPAAAHVDFHEQNPKEKNPKHITRIKMLSRQQKIDMCAVCHSGNDKLTQKSTFTFNAGDTLSNYYFPQYTRSTKEPDVHGNQYGMLSASACFIKSDMDCSSCHNTHVTEKNNTALFSQRCLSCHQADTHPRISDSGSSLLAQNCIDCHMPVQPSKLITFQLAGKTQKTPYLLRSHRVAIYPGETEKILSFLKSK